MLSVVGLRDFFIPKIHETDAVDLSKIEIHHDIRSVGQGIGPRKMYPTLIEGVAWAVVGDRHPL